MLRIRYLNGGFIPPWKTISIDGSHYRIDSAGACFMGNRRTGWLGKSGGVRLRPFQLPEHGLDIIAEPPRLTLWQRLKNFFKR